MKPGSRDDLQRVTPQALRAYLERRSGWYETDTMASGAGHYYEVTDANDAVLVLRSTHYADYTLRMAENLAVLAEYEHRDAEHILQDLLASDDDVVRICVDTLGGNRSLPLSAGTILLGESRKLISAAARAAVQPERAYATKPGKVVQDYLRSIQFGHTERGSFVLPIYSPVSLDLLDQPTAITDEGFPRRAMRTLVSALDAACGDVSEGTARHAQSLESQITSGVSANLCNALSALIALSGGVTVSVNWALAYPPPRTNYDVRFDSQDRVRLDETSRVLTHEEAMTRLSGPVLRLARDPRSDKGSATIRTVVDGVDKTVRIGHLSANLYSRIVEAHRQRRTVSVRGRLRRRGNSWQLVETRGVEIMEED